jgi:signal peptide peptidase SppA
MNRYEQSLQRHEPLLAHANEIRAIVERCILNDRVGFKEYIESIFGKAPEPYTIGNTHVIPISGVIGKGLAPIETALGGFDVNMLGQWLDDAEGKNYERIIFNIDSPGGTVTGIPEIADRIRNLNTKTVAYTDSIAASGAYWIAAAADAFVVSPSSMVGSIGVYTTFIDVTEMLANDGIKLEVLKSGEHKAAGMYGTSLTDEQRTEILNRVKETHEQFKAAVLQKRILADVSAMDGRVFTGRQAVSLNLATGISDRIQNLLKQVDIYT